MMNTQRQNVLIIQDDGQIFFRSHHPEAKIVQPFLSQFAQLIKSPSDIHMYHLSPFSVWYAFSLGVKVNEIKSFLENFSGAPLPDVVEKKLETWARNSEVFKMVNDSEVGPCLFSKEKGLIYELLEVDLENIRQDRSGEYLVISMKERGALKQQLMQKGYPVTDLLGYDEGNRLSMSLTDSVSLRPYQKEAVASFLEPKSDAGNGFIILPCGSGKTIVGLGIMNEIKEDTLVIVPNDTAVQQWYREIVEKTSLTKNEVGIYTSEAKIVKPVTITTYQMLTYRHPDKNYFPHFRLFDERSWGLVIYDEVHLLPAPLFRITSNLQGKRRVGLTATFVREDGKEGDIYSLIGPKRYEVGMKVLENNGWISQPKCIEIKVPLREKQWEKYLHLSKREQFRFASENKEKILILDELLKKHQGQKILVIGQYLTQLKQIASIFHLPLITGETSKSERQELYDSFRKGEIETIVLSRVANMAVDLPDAQVAIQVSGTFGSRQEEAQRIGRLLRLKEGNQGVLFYTLVTSMTREEELSSHRQLFMQEQGYSYEWEEWSS
ncbi:MULTISPECIES: DNA repair helicase XPB [Bacillaceae]|uniref:DNA 3'-5' helicase n=1 Tax=Evansella alkalicola TaxID=745819 RepID=A0ABS6JPL5_9BACI|nr:MULTISPECIES: DNA repair helicase XPB [Bacillaceae]MBU9720470.1 DEAD/DEAH box helicase [Bacillus alkalicola]